MRHTDIEDDWTVYVAWIAILGHERRDDSTRLDLHQTEEDVRQAIEQEGGRPREFYWRSALDDLGWNASFLRLIAVFEARGQYPIQFGHDSVSLEKYIHPPDHDPEELPESLGSEAMVRAIRDMLNGSGDFLVVNIEQWVPASDFIPAEEMEARTARSIDFFAGLHVQEDVPDDTDGNR